MAFELAIVPEAGKFSHLVIWSSGHLVIWSSGHLVIDEQLPNQ
jgi:hypothetical protein